MTYCYLTDILQAQGIAPLPNSSKRKAENTPGEDETDEPVDQKPAIPEVIELDDDGNEDVESELKALQVCPNASRFSSIQCSSIIRLGWTYSRLSKSRKKEKNRPQSASSASTKQSSYRAKLLI